MTATTIHLETTSDVIGYIAARATEAIASKNAPGHDLDTVLTRMTTDKALSTMRSAYEFRLAAGDAEQDAAIKVGVRMIQAYRIQYDI